MRASLRLLPVASSIATAQTGSQKLDKFSGSDRLLPLNGSHASNACAAYGPDYVKVEGTEMCVQVSGSVSVGVRGSIGAR